MKTTKQKQKKAKQFGFMEFCWNFSNKRRNWTWSRCWVSPHKTKKSRHKKIKNTNENFNIQPGRKSENWTQKKLDILSSLFFLWDFAYFFSIFIDFLFLLFFCFFCFFQVSVVFSVVSFFLIFCSFLIFWCFSVLFFFNTFLVFFSFSFFIIFCYFSFILFIFF